MRPTILRKTVKSGSDFRALFGSSVGDHVEGVAGSIAAPQNMHRFSSMRQLSVAYTNTTSFARAISFLSCFSPSFRHAPRLENSPLTSATMDARMRVLQFTNCKIADCVGPHDPLSSARVLLYCLSGGEYQCQHHDSQNANQRASRAAIP